MTARDASHPLEKLNPKVRNRFPMVDRDSRGTPRIYLNTGAGSLTVDTAAGVAHEAQGRLNPMPGSVATGELDTAALHARVRDLVADFLHAGDGREVSFHQSATSALFNLAFSLRSVLAPSANLVVTDLDHMANISPWETVWGEGHGAEVRRARVTPEGTLDVGYLLSLVDRRTGLVALTAASNGTGSIVPLEEVASAVRRISPGCLVAVDAVHQAPHGVIDVRASSVDFLAFSGYKVFGPMLGVLWGKAEILERLKPYRVETNKDVLPWKFEMGMLNNASLASLEAAMEYLLWLDGLVSGPASVTGDRGYRFRSVMTAIADYEKGLTRRVLEGFLEFAPDRFRCFGIADPARSGERVPTFAFEIAGLTPTETKKRLWAEAGIQIADGNHYSAAIFRHLGRPEGLCRASFGHYDNAATVERLLEAIRRLLD
ncbi:MAG: aminotransferase class V-fold PLP-dependent enzyme [Candidatus Aminicenantes bacterium]|nr:aminotransferase class V-fold PLP-dependent enzyme [Candidatus Aminicenantes bacterium]